MCQCTPEIRTPFCGKPGCEWPPQQPQDDSAPKWLGSLGVLKLEPGDKLVVRVSDQWSGDIDLISQTLFSLFPENQCIVLAAGIDIGVLRDSPAPKVERKDAISPAQYLG